MILKRLFLFLSITALLFSNDRDPSLVVSGVHLFTGDYGEVIEDMKSSGAIPLRTERSFAPPTPKSEDNFDGSLWGGWNWNWHNDIEFFSTKEGYHHRHLETTYHGPHGGKLLFNVRKHKRPDEESHLFAKQRQGGTNGKSWKVSGKSNTHNMSLLFNKKRTEAILRNGAGDEKFFCYSKAHGTDHHFYIDREELANGLTLKYKHDANGDLERVALLAMDGKTISHLDVNCTEPNPNNIVQDITDAHGQTLRYTFSKFRMRYESEETPTDRWALEHVKRPHLPDIHYTYVLNDKYLRGKIAQISCPDGRNTAFTYYNKGKTSIPGTTDKKDLHHDNWRIGRVKKVLAPLGENGEVAALATFWYERIGDRDFVKQGITTVFDSKGKKTDYEHDDLRLKTIHFWGPHNHAVEMREQFVWARGEENEGDLLVRYVEDANRNVLLAREYIYDDNHNVVEEKLFGNISGDSFGPSRISDKGIVHSTGDCQVAKFRYSNDGRNLLLWEKRGDLETDYSYYPNSSHLAKKVERDPSGLFRSTAYEYDNRAQVCCEILNDETGFHLEKRIRNNSLGLPEEIETVGLKKEIYRYSPSGQILETEIVDLSGVVLSQHAYSYDAKNNCIYERTPIGQEIFRSFDANNNLVYEKGPDPRVERHFRYDFMNRLIEVKEIHPEGERSSYCRYNKRSQKTKDIDFRGYQIKYSYDWRASPSGTLFPEVITSDGAFSYATSEEHNTLGHLISKTAADGSKTMIEPTILGAPVRILYPDGSIERFGYNLFGQKLFHVERGGLRHEYSYDAFGRLTSEKLFDEKGVFLSEIKKRYSGLQLIEEIDSYGIPTNYRYDSFGRLKEKRRGELFEESHYDALGRLIEMITPLATKRFIYDPAGRLLDEQSLSPSGILEARTEYGYDEAGNRSKIVEYLEENKPLVTEITYDSFGRIVHKKQGSQQIHVEYIDDFINAFGQRVEKKIITAQDGIVTEIEKDPLGRDLIVEKKGTFGETLQLKQNHYDALGRLDKTEETVYFQGKAEKVIVNSFCYNSDGELIESIEAANSPERKKFTHEYFLGRKIKTIKPDGIALNFNYDAMGKMVRLSASDKTIDYEYRYDGLVRLTEVIDHIAGTTLKRTYDQEEHLLQEEFPDYTISYSYDPFGRLSQVSLLGQSWNYRYEGNRLARIDRNRKGNPYEIGFAKYDLAGELKQLNLLGRAGSVTYHHDEDGINTGFTHPLITDSILSFDPVKRPRLHMRIADQESLLCSIKYDPLGQVTEEGGRSYLFDSLFNLREERGKKHSYNNLNQRIGLRYDLNGNLLEADGMRFHYDALDRLTQVDVAGTQVHYSYDGLHRRLSSGNKRFLYQGECEIGSITDDKINELRIVHSARFGEVGSTVAIEVGDKAYAVLNDHFGNIAALIDESGSLVENNRFSPFGKGIKKEGIHPWRYSSKRLDTETGLVFFGQRFYSIDQMRWLTPDPLSLKDGSNLYAYVHNNPIQQVDAFGLFAERGGWLDGMLNCFFSFPGRCVEFFGRHCIPVPLVREAIEFTGWILQGKDHQAWTPSYSRDHSVSGCYLNGAEVSDLSTLPGDYGIYQLNGMNCNSEEFQQQMMQLSKEKANVPIFYTYNGSKGFMTDLVECVINKLGISTPPVDKMAAHISEIYKAKGKDFELLLLCHSQGGLITSLVGEKLDPDIMARIDVRTFGSAKFIDDEKWKSAINYVSTRDPIPMVDLFKLYSHGTSNSSQLVVLESKSGTFFDHSYSGDTYKHASNTEIDRYIYERRK